MSCLRLGYADSFFMKPLWVAVVLHTTTAIKQLECKLLQNVMDKFLIKCLLPHLRELLHFKTISFL